MRSVKELLSANAGAMPKCGMTEFFDLPPDVISLGLGEPGFVTPKSVCGAGIAAIEGGCTAYAPGSGYYGLRSATAEYLVQRYGFSYAPEEVLVTLGASLGLDCIMRTFVGAGEEVLIPKPAYGYYSTLTALSGGRAVFVPTFQEDGWALTPEALRESVTERSKLLILNYPNNPTGAVMSEEQFAAIAEVIRDTDIIVVADEVYAECVFDSAHASILHHEGMRERTLLVSGFSKSMAMTGWRIGYVCGPHELLEPVAAVNAAVTLCASSIAQKAALGGLREGRADMDRMTAEYRLRREFVMERARAMGWRFSVPGGAFYLWADISETGMDAATLAGRLISEARVALMPGTVFGSEYSDYVRVTYSYSMEVLTEAFRRIEHFMDVQKNIY